jgi:septal ring factor EnvC (AmiA/AmiB activator)
MKIKTNLLLLAIFAVSLHASEPQKTEPKDERSKIEASIVETSRELIASKNRIQHLEAEIKKEQAGLKELENKKVEQMAKLRSLNAKKNP